MNLYVSTSVYALGHELGMVGALKEMQRQLASPDKLSLPVVRTIHRLRQLANIQLGFDCGGTVLGMVRSRAFHEAFQSKCDAWISIDDDIEVTTQTAASMLEVLDDVAPRVVITPYAARVPDSVNTRLCVEIPKFRIERNWRGAKLVRLEKGRGGGFGFVGMNRHAMREIVKTSCGYRTTNTGEQISEYKNSQLSWVDVDGTEKLALFHEILEDGLWYAEDMAFFRRVPSSVSVEALLVGTVNHAG